MYQKNRSVIKLECTLKMSEKVIATKNSKIFIMFLDMSKAINV